jgi:hypothetical protein
MEVTKELLKKLFDEYNQKYFYGKLGKCTFSLFSKNNLCLGKFSDREDKNGKPKDKIWIGTCVRWTEEALKSVLIHEMTHMYNIRVEKCLFNGLTGHGFYFKRQRRRLKRDYGIDINPPKNLDYVVKAEKPPLWGKILYWFIS